MEGLKTLEGFDFKKKKVFLRTGFDVPVDDDGNVLDAYRIKESVPTIKALFKKGAKQVIIGSHQGRPNGFEQKLSLKKIARMIFSLTHKRVEFVSDYKGSREELSDAPVIVLENLRFHDEEYDDDEDFAKSLASLADVYVNDAFAVCHRKHASMHAIAKFLPGCVGLLVEKELRVFEYVLEYPQVPFAAVIGGSKLKTKLPVIQNLIDKVDHVLLGGAMIFTFYKAKGLDVGKSLVDKTYLTNATMLNYNEKVYLPRDVVLGEGPDSTQTFNVSPDKIPSYLMGLDVGSKSVEDMKEVLSECRTVVWNGPLGYYENPFFAKATVELLKFLASKPEIKTIIGGGDTASVVMQLGLKDKFYHVSTGGGASLKLLEGKSLPAVDALKN